MTNSDKLKEKIQMSGLKMKYVAAYLGVSYQTLNRKINNITDFTSTEIQNLCVLLRIDSLEERQDIFFNIKVD